MKEIINELPGFIFITLGAMFCAFLGSVMLEQLFISHASMNWSGIIFLGLMGVGLSGVAIFLAFAAANVLAGE